MPTYRVTVREVHETVYEVFAPTKAEVEYMFTHTELDQPTECKVIETLTIANIERIS